MNLDLFHGHRFCSGNDIGHDCLYLCPSVYRTDSNRYHQRHRHTRELAICHRFPWFSALHFSTGFLQFLAWPIVPRRFARLSLPARNCKLINIHADGRISNCPRGIAARILLHFHLRRLSGMVCGIQSAAPPIVAIRNFAVEPPRLYGIRSFHCRQCTVLEKRRPAHKQSLLSGKTLTESGPKTPLHKSRA